MKLNTLLGLVPHKAKAVAEAAVGKDDPEQYVLAAARNEMITLLRRVKSRDNQIADLEEKLLQAQQEVKQWQERARCLLFLQEAWEPLVETANHSHTRVREHLYVAARHLAGLPNGLPEKFEQSPEQIWQWKHRAGEYLRKRGQLRIAVALEKIKKE